MVDEFLLNDDFSGIIAQAVFGFSFRVGASALRRGLNTSASERTGVLAFIVGHEIFAACRKPAPWPDVEADRLPEMRTGNQYGIHRISRIGGSGAFELGERLNYFP